LSGGPVAGETWRGTPPVIRATRFFDWFQELAAPPRGLIIGGRATIAPLTPDVRVVDDRYG
jgi:hypothetical protein